MILFGDHRTKSPVLLDWGSLGPHGSPLWESVIHLTSVLQYLFSNNSSVKLKGKRPAKKERTSRVRGSLDACLDMPVPCLISDLSSRCPSVLSHQGQSPKFNDTKLVSDWIRTWTSVSKLQIYYPFLTLLCACVHHTSLDQLWSWRRIKIVTSRINQPVFLSKLLSWRFSLKVTNFFILLPLHKAHLFNAWVASVAISSVGLFLRKTGQFCSWWYLSFKEQTK